ncbi:MAG: IS607 family transposase [Promethearchaeota archaeon]|jgi:excisionase family DNA binding protein
MTDEYLRPEEACRLLKVTTRTLYNWNRDGKIKSIKTKGDRGHHRYLKSSLIPFIPENQRVGRKICYCRVSSASQKEDLERQVEYFRTTYPNHEIVKDIGSGINFKRKGFNSILDSAIKGDISEVVVTHRDRLCRFGFELVNRIICGHSNGKVVVLNQEKTSPQEELVNDLLSIITVFSSRLYGLRSNSLKRKIKEASENFENENVSESKGKGEVTIDV